MAEMRRFTLPPVPAAAAAAACPPTAGPAATPAAAQLHGAEERIGH